MYWVWCDCGLIFVYIVSDRVTSCSSLVGSNLKVCQPFRFLYNIKFRVSLHVEKMGLIEKFSLTKLCAALQRKDKKKIEKRNKMGVQLLLARRGIGSIKPVAIVRPIPRKV